MNTENITRVRRLDLNTVLYSGSAYQSQGSSAAGHWINDCIKPNLKTQLPASTTIGSHVSSTDVQRFEPHLGHNLLSYSVFLVKSRHFGLPLTQTIRPNWQSLLAGGSVAIQTWSIHKVYA